MKHFIQKMKLKKLMEKKIAKSSGSSVEWMDEESYFFRLSKWEKPLLDYYDNNPDFISPKARKMKSSVLLKVFKRFVS